MLCVPGIFFWIPLMSFPHRFLFAVGSVGLWQLLVKWHFWLYIALAGGRGFSDSCMVVHCLHFSKVWYCGRKLFSWYLVCFCRTFLWCSCWWLGVVGGLLGNGYLLALKILPQFLFWYWLKMGGWTKGHPFFYFVFWLGCWLLGGWSVVYKCSQIFLRLLGKSVLHFWTFLHLRTNLKVSC